MQHFKYNKFFFLQFFNLDILSSFLLTANTEMCTVWTLDIANGSKQRYFIFRRTNWALVGFPFLTLYYLAQHVRSTLHTCARHLPFRQISWLFTWFEERMKKPLQLSSSKKCFLLFSEKQEKQYHWIENKEDMPHYGNKLWKNYVKNG